jgi:hypothetical protein
MAPRNKTTGFPTRPLREVRLMLTRIFIAIESYVQQKRKPVKAPAAPGPAAAENATPEIQGAGDAGPAVSGRSVRRRIKAVIKGLFKKK